MLVWCGFFGMILGMHDCPMLLYCFCVVNACLRSICCRFGGGYAVVYEREV